MKIIQTDFTCPEKDMQADLEALKNLTYGDEIVLHIYRWHPCITYGALTEPEEWIDINKSPLSLYQRPTGGGILFHYHDLSFSLIVPHTHPASQLPTLEKYRFINEAVVKALCGVSLNLSTVEEEKTIMRFCLAHATQYDLVLNGMKVGGSAQRKLKTGFLHQGTITLHLPSKDLLMSVLKPSCSHLADRMHSASSSLFSHPPSEKEREELCKYLISSFEANFRT